MLCKSIWQINWWYWDWKIVLEKKISIQLIQNINDEWIKIILQIIIYHFTSWTSYFYTYLLKSRSYIWSN